MIYLKELGRHLTIGIRSTTHNCNDWRRVQVTGNSRPDALILSSLVPAPLRQWDLSSVGVAGRFCQRLSQLLLQARAEKMLQPFGRFVQVIQRQRKVLAEVRLPQAMPSHQHLGELPAAVGERQPGRTMVGDFATPSDFRRGGSTAGQASSGRRGIGQSAGECCAIRAGRCEPLDLLRAGRASA